MSEKPVNTLPKAYHDARFLDSPGGRPVRILSEYLEPHARFAANNVADTIVFMGSARWLSRDVAEATLEQIEKGGDADEIRRARRGLQMSRYYEEARELAHRLTVWSKERQGQSRRFVVCTGGGPGIMEAANRGASEARGINIGLNIEIPTEQHENPYVTRALGFNFHYFFMRKFWFVYLAKAVVFFPGGYGTLDELFRTLTLVQTGKLTKRLPLVLYGTDYWKKIVNWDALVENAPSARPTPTCCSTPTAWTTPSITSPANWWPNAPAAVCRPPSAGRPEKRLDFSPKTDYIHIKGMKS
ncbi:MAG: LOG family protein [Proteobacteria bacterium]|nr:LOG family protein [Pseudomonadota bacterium]